MSLDADACYSALLTRDARFDGLFFVGVKTTGVYCRPVCRARTPGQNRCVFFATAAEAEREGFRACFRCRPELAPGNAPMDAVPRLVAAAARRIGEGALNEQTVDELAGMLGVTGRHLHRSMVAELGVSPLALAQTQRLAFAKRLLHDSSLGMTEIAFAAGFQSVRRFNAAFRARFGRPPSAVRRDLAARVEPLAGDSVRLRLDYRPPLAWGSLLSFLKARAIPGVEHIEPDSYRRTVSFGEHMGWVAVEPQAGRPALVATVSMSLAGKLPLVVAGLRRLFDLDARPAEIDASLAQDNMLRESIRQSPGLRVPGAFDGFEMAVRAVLGQQVTVKGATTLAGRLVAHFGKLVETPFAELHHGFPSPATLAAATGAEVASLGMPGARAQALIELARAVHGGLRLEPGVDVAATIEQLGLLRGFGDWTRQYVAMRALSWPDAFPAADLGVLKVLGVTTRKAALKRSEVWRPWRAYATLHLWSANQCLH